MITGRGCYRKVLVMRRIGVLAPFRVFVVLGILAAIYVGVHIYLYRNCAFTPGLFSWPRVCL